jgi:hypothetical protein
VTNGVAATSELLVSACCYFQPLSGLGSKYSNAAAVRDKCMRNEATGMPCSCKEELSFCRACRTRAMPWNITGSLLTPLLHTTRLTRQHYMQP